MPSYFYSIFALINEPVVLMTLITPQPLASFPPVCWCGWKISVIWFPLHWFWLGTSAPGVLDPVSLAPINHGQARFHTHCSHTSSCCLSNSCTGFEKAGRGGFKVEKEQSVESLFSAPDVLNFWLQAVAHNSFGSQECVKFDVNVHISQIFCEFVGYNFYIYLRATLLMLEQ